MKTTLDLPADLLIEAKTVAARRRTTLKAIMERALRRELRPDSGPPNPDPNIFEANELGMLVLRKRPGFPPVTPASIRALQDQIDAEDAQHAGRSQDQ